MTDTYENNEVAKVAELIKDARIAMLTTMTESGKHVARPMGLQSVEFDGDLWFFTRDDSNKIAQIRVNPEVNVSFSDQKHNAWTSLSGTASQVNDRQKMEDLWNPFLKAWFPDGVETPGITLIKVHVDTAEYWSSADSKVVTLIGMAKAAVTGKPYSGGENETVELS